ncbi:hypothetical protein Tco_1407150 [Tanacetum coccineum]
MIVPLRILIIWINFNEVDNLLEQETNLLLQIVKENHRGPERSEVLRGSRNNSQTIGREVEKREERGRVRGKDRAQNMSGIATRDHSHNRSNVGAPDLVYETEFEQQSCGRLRMLPYLSRRHRVPLSLGVMINCFLPSIFAIWIAGFDHWFCMFFLNTASLGCDKSFKSVFDTPWCPEEAKSLMSYWLITIGR